MKAEQFIILTREGEGTKLEYKTCTEQISDSLYETICSFLNHSGGRILVGVKDSGEIVGVNSDKAAILKSDIISGIRNQELFLPCPYFTPQIMEVEGKVVLLLDIPSGQYVYRYKGRYWERNGESDIDITDQPELLLTLGNVTQNGGNVTLKRRNVTQKWENVTQNRGNVPRNGRKCPKKSRNVPRNE